MRKFPITLFVFREEEGTANEYLVYYTTIEDVAVRGKERLVGIYKLAGTGLVRTKIELETNLILKIRKK